MTISWTLAPTSATGGNICSTCSVHRPGQVSRNWPRKALYALFPLVATVATCTSHSASQTRASVSVPHRFGAVARVSDVHPRLSRCVLSCP